MNLSNISINNFFYLEPLHLEECRGVAVFFLLETLFNTGSLKGIGLYAFIERTISIEGDRRFVKHFQAFYPSRNRGQRKIFYTNWLGKFPSERYLFEQF